MRGHNARHHQSYIRPLAAAFEKIRTRDKPINPPRSVHSIFISVVGVADADASLSGDLSHACLPPKRIRTLTSTHTTHIRALVANRVHVWTHTHTPSHPLTRPSVHASTIFEWKHVYIGFTHTYIYICIHVHIYVYRYT